MTLLYVASKQNNAFFAITFLILGIFQKFFHQIEELIYTQLKIEQWAQYFNNHRSYSLFCDSLWDLQYIILLDDSYDYASYRPAHLDRGVNKNVPSYLTLHFHYAFLQQNGAKPHTKAVFFLKSVQTTHLFNFFANSCDLHRKIKTTFM